MKLEGVFLYYDKENKNGRIYTKEVAKEIVKQFNEMDKGFCLGELGQPSEHITNLINVSHEVEEIHINEKDKSIEGTIKILDTPKGKLLTTLIEEFKEGSDIKFSGAARGTGTINKNKEVEDYTLHAFDIIPLKESAFPNPLKITDL